MKRLIRSIVVAGGFAALVGVTPASAQIFQEVTFTTSFPFTVGQTTLPAGSYTVRPAYEGDGSVLEIQGRDHSATFVGQNAGKPRVNPDESAVVFDRTGDHYVLAEIWDGSDREGADLIPHHKGGETVKVDAHRGR